MISSPSLLNPNSSCLVAVVITTSLCPIGEGQCQWRPFVCIVWNLPKILNAACWLGPTVYIPEAAQIIAKTINPIKNNDLFPWGNLFRKGKLFLRFSTNSWKDISYSSFLPPDGGL